MAKYCSGCGDNVYGDPWYDHGDHTDSDKIPFSEELASDHKGLLLFLFIFFFLLPIFININ